jgi:hypothetical protein
MTAALAVPLASLFVLLASAWCPPNTRGPKCATTSSPADVAITDVRFYAWYWDFDTDQVTYHEVTEFPVSDDQDPYPTFDIVLTVENRGREWSDAVTARLTLTYQIMPLPTEKTGETPEQAYERCKRQAEWGKPEWTQAVGIGAVGPGEVRRVRAATVVLNADCRNYWDKGQWPLRARIEALLPSPQGRQPPAPGMLHKELTIDMLD